MYIFIELFQFNGSDIELVDEKLVYDLHWIFGNNISNERDERNRSISQTTGICFGSSCSSSDFTTHQKFYCNQQTLN
jgi:hypothetical protein